MKITYIEHSGYAIEWESCIWVFDYYRGKIPDWEKTKPLIIFASHAHKDHFAPEIFSLFKEFEHITYLLSTDIRKKIKRMSLDEKVLAQIRYAAPGEQLSLPVSEGKEILVLGINKILNWCQIISGGRRYTCPTKLIDGKLFFHFKKEWHSVAEFISDNAEELVTESGKVFSRSFKE